MKNLIKSNLIGFIFGIILCSGIVYATSYLASDISYTPSDASWKVNNVSDALTELYEKTQNNSGGLSFTYSGGGYMSQNQRALSSSVIFNDNYKKINVTFGIVSVVFNYIDGTTSSAVLVKSGNSLQIPENVESISCRSESESVASNDGWGGQWLSVTATIQLEK